MKVTLSQEGTPEAGLSETDKRQGAQATTHALGQPWLGRAVGSKGWVAAVGPASTQSSLMNHNAGALVGRSSGTRKCQGHSLVNQHSSQFSNESKSD